MSFFEIVLTAISLSLDAVAVAMAAGALQRLALRQTLKIALFFGGFQLIMPLIGWLVGSNFQDYLLKHGNRIGFMVLLLIGLKMLYEALKKPDEKEMENRKFITHTKVLLPLAIATSTDALIIGITYNFITVNIPLAVATIGLLTFLLCILGVYIGTKSRSLAGNKIELLGAFILIGLAFKILLL